MRWRNDTTKFLYRRAALNNAWDIIENYGATTSPTTGDDAAVGYARGSVWINVTDDRVFWCTNPATGAVENLLAAARWHPAENGLLRHDTPRA